MDTTYDTQENIKKYEKLQKKKKRATLKVDIKKRKI